MKNSSFKDRFDGCGFMTLINGSLLLALLVLIMYLMSYSDILKKVRVYQDGELKYSVVVDTISHKQKHAYDGTTYTLVLENKERISTTKKKYKNVIIDRDSIPFFTYAFSESDKYYVYTGENIKTFWGFAQTSIFTVILNILFFGSFIIITFFLYSQVVYEYFSNEKIEIREEDTNTRKNLRISIFFMKRLQPIISGILLSLSLLYVVFKYLYYQFHPHSIKVNLLIFFTLSFCILLPYLLLREIKKYKKGDSNFYLWLQFILAFLVIFNFIVAFYRIINNEDDNLNLSNLVHYFIKNLEALFG